jgi:hypothetical protein
MKTIYFKRLKSGNYESCSRSEATEKIHTKKELKLFWDRIQREITNVWDSFRQTYKRAAIIKARYRLSQTYYSSFEELYKKFHF